MTIEEFKQTQDYKDIMYMIKHVPYVKTRCDILRELGYKVVIGVITNPKIQIKRYVFLDKQKRIRIQISDKHKDNNYAFYIVYDGN